MSEDTAKGPGGSGCEKSKKLLPGYVLGDLSQNDRLLVERHVAECSSCREDLARISNAMRFLKNHDPAGDAASGLSEKRRKRVIWIMGHPFLAFCAVHHKLVSFVVSIILTALIVTALFFMKYYVRPDSALAPVEISVPDAEEGNPPELENSPDSEAWELGY